MNRQPVQLQPATTQEALAAIYGEVTERELDSFIARHCLVARLLHYHTHVSIRSQRGFPDWVILRPPERYPAPWVLLWEGKTERGQLRAEQRNWGAWLTAIQRVCPAIDYRVVRPSDQPLILKLLVEDQYALRREER